MRDRLEVRKDSLPYRVTVPLGAAVYGLEFHYNEADDRFTVSLYRGETLLCAGEPLVYGRALFADCFEAEKYPVLRLVPWDEGGECREVGYETLGTRVFLTVEDTDGNGKLYGEGGERLG